MNVIYTGQKKKN